MDGSPARNWTVEDTDITTLSANDGACASAPPLDLGWIDLLPHPAAIALVEGTGCRIERANAAFRQSFAQPQDGVLPVGSEDTGFWNERIAAFRTSDRASDHFELRQEGRLGPEYFACDISQLQEIPGERPRLLLTALDQTRERLIERNLRRELLSDSLTTLPNRTGFGEEIEDRLNNGIWPDGSSFAVLVVDLVRFSRVNESLGALAGDELIITVAKRLKSCLRQGDVLGRIGGNEFAMFVRLNSGLSDALHIVQRINDALAAPVRLSQLQISVDGAIGCAFSDRTTDEPEDIVRQAQAAVKLAKRTGKLEIYRVGALKEAHRRFTLESRLREALANGGLTLAFQPLIHLRSGELTGFEALARWIDPELGEVAPSEFIPAAEESGLIVPLGRWAIYEAVQAAARWDRMHGDALPIGVNVNLSPIQMARDDVPSVVEEALRYGGVSGKRLTIELTESAIVADPDKARQVLNALKGLDVSIAMDDFGTGFSNLASLQSLPIDVLKIDRSFVTEMLEDRDKHAIVRAILSLADSLNLKVTAEGIESAPLAAALNKLGCWQGQGYYFAPAMNDQSAFDYWRARWNFETV
jgi:cyclic di-GMP phosphodiesterase Gmr